LQRIKAVNRYAIVLPAVLALAVAGAHAQIVAEAASDAAAAAPSAQVDAALLNTPGDGRQGTVKTVRGEVTLVSGQTRRAVIEGGAVRQGDRVVTGAASTVSIALRDGTVVFVSPNSAVELALYRFEPTSEDGNAVLSLLKGSLRVVTGLITRAAPATEPAKVKVTTPTAVIGIRGTDAVVDANS
jgi:hypothetical protein